MGPIGRQQLAQTLQRSGRQPGKPPPFLAQRIGGQGADAAAIGQNGQSIPVHRPCQGQRCHGAEQFIHSVDPQQPGALKGGIVEGVCLESDFEHDDRLDPSRRPSGGHEFAGLRNGFEVEQDSVGVLFKGEIIQQVPEIHIHHVPQGDQVGKASRLTRKRSP